MGLQIALIVLFLLIQSSTASHEQYVPRLPTNPELWKYSVPLGFRWPKRLWDERLLVRANAQVTNDRLFSLLRKLDRGEPIVVVAMGSSVVSDYGGCFHNSLDQIYQHVDKLDPVCAPCSHAAMYTVMLTH